MAPKTQRKIIPIIQRKLNLADKKDKVVEKGTLGKLEITVYERGVLHITDPAHPDLIFKKDPETFEQDMDLFLKQDKDGNCVLSRLNPGESVKIQGSGDNDHLILTVTHDKIEACLESRGFGVIRTIQNFIAKAKRLVEVSKIKENKK